MLKIAQYINLAIAVDTESHLFSASAIHTVVLSAFVASAAVPSVATVRSLPAFLGLEHNG